MADVDTDKDAVQVYLLGKTHLANNQGQFFIKNDPIVQLAAGDRHTIILTATGRAFAFGDNSSGQLGLGHTNNVEKVSCIKSLKFQDSGEKVILAACAREASIVATNHGAIYAFGSNSGSQLGLESPAVQPLPTKIEPLRGLKWKQLAMGAEHACALTVDGQVYAWGNNEDGQCGQMQKDDVVKVPREMRIEFSVASISCGYYHTALVSDEGELYVCGNNEDRQLGRSIANKFHGPEKVSIPDRVKAVACGHQHTVVLTEKGEVYTCGDGSRGQLGLSHRVLSAETFELVPGLPKRLSAIAAGEGHTAVLSARGDLYVFGDGKHGKLGSPTHSNEMEPCLVEKFKSYEVLKVVCGGCQTIALGKKKSTESKRLSGSDEETENMTLSVTQRPKSRARVERNKSMTDRSVDTTLRSVRPLGAGNPHLRVEPDIGSDAEKSDKELSESLKSATFNQTHTITHGRFLPTQSPVMTRTQHLRANDETSKPIRTGALDRTVQLNKDPEPLSKTSSRFPPVDKPPVRGARGKDLSGSDEEEEEERDFRKPIAKKSEPLPPQRRRDDSDNDEDSRQRPAPVKKPISEKSPPKPTDRRDRFNGRDEDDNDDDDTEEEEARDKPSPSNREKKASVPPPTVARRGSLPTQTRAIPGDSGNRNGNQTIGSKPTDGVRGSFRTPATGSLAKPAAIAEVAKKETPAAPEHGFFSRIFGSKPKVPPPAPAPAAPTPAAPAGATPPSRTCSMM